MKFIKTLLLLSTLNLTTISYSQPLLDSLLTQKTIYTSIEEALKNPEQVFMLNVGYSAQEINPNDLLIFKNLQGLDISAKIDLDTFPGVLQQLKNLQWISIIDNNICVVTNDILNLQHLNSLNLNNNKIDLIPDFNDVNTSLTDLSLYSNDLKNIPESIGKLKSLRSLGIGDNIIQTLPEQICYMENLEFLDICHNQIEHLPDSIMKLNGTLRRFDIQGNKFGLDYCYLIQDLLPDTEVIIGERNDCRQTYKNFKTR